MHDNGSVNQRRNYILLLRKVASIYNLTGLPDDLGSLFENYTVPPHTPVKTPIFAFFDLPQFLDKDFDFDSVEVDTRRVQSGNANVLFNEDFTLIFGRLGSTKKPHYGYRVMLITNDGANVFTAYRHTIDKKSYRYSHAALLSDLQELVVAALYRHPKKLAKYREDNDKIANFLDCKCIVSQGFKRFPIRCFVCKEDKYVTRITDGKPGKSCDVCFQKWKALNSVQPQSKWNDAALDLEPIEDEVTQARCQFPGADRVDDNDAVFDDEGEYLGNL
ncbi:hypothetical protein LEP3755_23810 [Leptolyngbya sp. NIES-3755]|nr:hypothetical protein LEP3755_23810 [Leptolyngbya sp. NIES-3755]